jgi:2-dehydropantoate 2-reductase
VKIAVVGSGAVGGYFGGKLAAAGNDVTFVARGAQYDALRHTGLTLVTDEETTHLPHVRVMPSVTDLTEPDIVLVSVKGWDTDHVASDLARVVAKESLVLSLQNGVSARAALGPHLPDSQLLGGLCYINANVTAPGQVTRTGTLQQVTFGEFDRQASDRARGLLHAFTAAGIDASISDDTTLALWEKFVFLVAFSALTSATRAPIGIVRSHPATRALLLQVIAETTAVAAASEVQLPERLTQQTVDLIDSLPPTAMASMAVDLLAGRRLELPWLSGHVVAIADQAGTVVPASRAIVALLAPFELGRPEASA